ncbi:MAG: thiosulfate oxidation carrier complex protein SoxZ [Thiomargarita sp.]|nr:thiosulfate oxidation carrier complex protein SoxZ [Thiomargarita sp.]
MSKFRTRIKAKLVENEITEVKLLVKHPMERASHTNLETGEFVGTPHFIEEIECRHNDKIVMSGFWSGGISKDPFCAFRFKGGKAGDKVQFSWKDNLGNTGSKATEIG